MEFYYDEGFNSEWTEQEVFASNWDEVTKRAVTVGLVRGRHEIKYVRDKYIFEDNLNPTDLNDIKHKLENSEFAKALLDIRKASMQEINIYVTGLTVALIEVIKFVRLKAPKANITLHHYDISTSNYFPQEVF